MKKSDIISAEIYEDLCEKLNKIYSDYIESRHIKPKTECLLNIDDSDPACGNYKNIIQLNEVGNTRILRLNIETPLVSLRAKFLCDDEYTHSVINLIDFAIKDLYLRCGGFASSIINLLPYIGDVQLSKFGYDSKKIPIRMLIFRFFSLPFQLKNDFRLKFILDQLEEFDFIYSIFKLIMAMNQLVPMGDIEELEEFTFSEDNVASLLSDWILRFYNIKYSENNQMKDRFLNDVQLKKYTSMEPNQINLYTEVMYKNICNTFANDFLSANSIMTYLQENFYLEKFVGEMENVNKGSIKSDPQK